MCRSGKLHRSTLESDQTIQARRASFDVAFIVASPSRREGRSLSDGEGESQIAVCSSKKLVSNSPSPLDNSRLSRRESEVCESAFRNSMLASNNDSQHKSATSKRASEWICPCAFRKQTEVQHGFTRSRGELVCRRTPQLSRVRRESLQHAIHHLRSAP